MIPLALGVRVGKKKLKFHRFGMFGDGFHLFCTILTTISIKFGTSIFDQFNHILKISKIKSLLHLKNQKINVKDQNLD